MWKKPTIEMPDFKKANLEEMLEKESLETNGGLSIIPTLKPFPGPIIDPFPFPFPDPIILSGMVAKNFDLGLNK